MEEKAMSMIKNMDKAQVMVLKEQVSYQAGQVVSKMRLV